LARVSVPTIYAYKDASFKTDRIGTHHRDDLLVVQEIVTSPEGPVYNPTWLRLEDGSFVHSGRVQLIKNQSANTLLSSIPDGGVLAEVTVPMITTQIYSRGEGWRDLYRLYYESFHWIVGLDEGPDGQPWYRLRDTAPQVEYHVDARALRIVSSNEYTPIHGDVDPKDKRIVVSLDQQSLTAYESNQVVFSSRVATGIHTENLDPALLPTDTPRGNFHIQLKMPSRHMGDGQLTSAYTAYELVGVPWVMVFQKDGIALHGTYWHTNFGTPMSHGCVNLPNEAARWLFRWTEPSYLPPGVPSKGKDPKTTWYAQGMGTLVQVV
jgi:lipoprotein-anchoring transpeptidase ErfK/SrfK